MAKKIKAETMLKSIQKNNSTGKEVRTGGFSGFNFNPNGSISIFKKREIVKPYLHPIDSRIINSQIEGHVKNSLQSLDKDIMTNYSKFLPSHLINDLYSLYYNDSQRLTFEGLDKTNQVKFSILDSINNSLIKIITNSSYIGSYVYTEEISKFLYKKFMELPPEQQKKLQDALQNCNQGTGDEEGQEKEGEGQGSSGKGTSNGDSKPPDSNLNGQGSVDSNGQEQSQRNEGNSNRGMANNSHGKNSKKDMTQQAVDQMIKDLQSMLNNKSSKKELEKAMEEAEKKLDKLKDLGIDIENDQEMPEEERQEIVANLNNLDQIRKSLQALNTSKDKVMKVVQKILSSSSNYFSQKCITNDVELFEADQILDINGIEFLHPVFQKTKIFDLSITERRYIGKTDLYVDCSGSMSSGCGGDMNGVCRIDLAKSLAMQMKEMGILGELYEFEDRPKKIMNTEMSILMMAARGGTNIEYVLKNILKSGNNSIILTDGESSIDTYTHKALFIGVGTDFHYFKHDQKTGVKFVENNQCIVYNGKDFVFAEPPTKK